MREQILIIFRICPVLLQEIYFSYFWEDSPVTEAEFVAHIDELIDTSKCFEPSELYTKDEILEILAEQI